jgi:23S rRNA-/tRNA-specific pseudouridylate synthase
MGAVVARAGGDAEAIAEGRVFIGRVLAEPGPSGVSPGSPDVDADGISARRKWRRVKAASERVQPGDVVEIADRSPALPVSILARAGDLVAVDKPAGMPTIADLTGAAHALDAAAARTLGVPKERLHVTSRLDRDVSGVVVIVMSKAARERLQQARERGAYERRYVAIAERAPGAERGEWSEAIGRAKDPKLRAIGGRDAVPARTRYATIARAGLRVLLAVSPITGRTHQIRLHASHAGAPLLGDRAYGGPTRITLPNGRVLGLARIALHAARVVVPLERGELEAISPVPEALAELWGALGGDEEAWARALASQ